MPNLNILLKIASGSAILSFITAIILFTSSIFTNSAQAAHFSMLSNNVVKLKSTLKSHNKQHKHKNHITAPNGIAFKAMQIALKTVADGATYTWRHSKTKLSGLIHPTTTYRNGSGQLCRHIQITLKYKTTYRNSDVLACRNNQNKWVLKG